VNTTNIVTFRGGRKAHSLDAIAGLIMKLFGAA
jgi:hypothetical protein